VPTQRKSTLIKIFRCPYCRREQRGRTNLKCTGCGEVFALPKTKSKILVGVERAFDHFRRKVDRPLGQNAMALIAGKKYGADSWKKQ